MISKNYWPNSVEIRNLKNTFRLRNTWITTAAIIAISVLTLLIYCAAGTETGEPADQPSDAVSMAETEYDALGDPRDKAVLEEAPPVENEIEASQDNFEWAKLDSFMRAKDVTDSVNTIYRVQLFASQYYTEAQYERQIADEVFSDSVYVVYDLPYYKVLLGNATSEDQGKRLLYNARALGYYNSWLVESQPDSIYYRKLYVQDSLQSLNKPDSIPVTEKPQEQDE
jgi:hypothetical protein